jgi:hypothetical protein
LASSWRSRAPVSCTRRRRTLHTCPPRLGAAT